VNQKVASRQIEKFGYRADIAANGLEVLESLSRIPYDIVLMDCQMPEMDGFEATREIRLREGENKHTIIIAMTANALEGDREKCLAAGMDDYLSKPVKVEELQRVLERWQPDSPQVHAAGVLSTTSEDAQAPVNIDCLLEAADGDEDLAQELMELYLNQMSEAMEKLDDALVNNAADEVNRLAHTAVGSSATIGMVTLIAPLKELERMGALGKLNHSAPLVAQVRKELERVKNLFQRLIAAKIEGLNALFG
jgi:CheY-like chemotaxis protein